MTLNNTLYINVVSYSYTSVNWLLYINYCGPVGQSHYKNSEFTFSLFTIGLYMYVAARNVEN